MFTVLYIDLHIAENSEVLDVCSTRSEAVKSLIKLAHYRENRNGQLTQYFNRSSDFESFAELKRYVTKNLQLQDENAAIYKIAQHKEFS